MWIKIKNFIKRLLFKKIRVKEETLISLLRSINEYSTKQLDITIAKLDVDKDGYIDLEEFLKLFGKK